MISNNEVQLISLLLSVFAGLIIGLLFDLYRTINFYCRPSKIFICFMDVLFWIITGVVVFSILLRADYAELRAYTFFGMIIGISIYIKLFSEYLLKFYRLFFYSLFKSVRVLVILTTLPFKLIYNLVWGPVNAVNKFLIGAWKRIILSISSKLKITKNIKR